MFGQRKELREFKEQTTNQLAILNKTLQSFVNNKVDQSTYDDSITPLKAAYALNLCTVSVSQIVDYNDLIILEQEYEAILNNINIEHMPNDDALLHIIKQILDIITFFRIQEGDKEIVEMEYQHKMKNAIWSAVPNIGLIIATPNPVAMAVSLASQIGIGYMNYRRQKAENLLEKKKWLRSKSMCLGVNFL